MKILWLIPVALVLAACGGSPLLSVAESRESRTVASITTAMITVRAAMDVADRSKAAEVSHRTCSDDGRVPEK